MIEVIVIITFCVVTAFIGLFYGLRYLKLDKSNNLSQTDNLAQEVSNYFKSSLSLGENLDQNQCNKAFDG